jgi:HTH-type transcriptional regulator/antitoxin HigA
VSVAPLHTESEYKDAKAKLAKLIGRTDATTLTEIELLAMVLEDYEKRVYAIAAPTPLAAIRFRMQQGGLQPKDLKPALGSTARISEVLSGTRPLSLDMIRALNRHFGIPAQSLIGQEPAESVRKPQIPSAAALQKLRDLGVMKVKETYEAFMKRMVGPQAATALLRKSRTERTNAKTDHAALTAWLATVKHLADSVTIDKPKPKKKVRGREAARTLAKLSSKPNGPALAREQLREWGIILITLEHLPGTYLDGAAMCREDGVAVIAMTLRHDRLDNFWFTLLHEFCHVSEHLVDGTTLILDDLDLGSSDAMENEADTFARDALIPPEIWAKYAAAHMDNETVVRAAKEAGVHHAVVAGRWQREHNDYRRFSKVLGRGEVRSQFAARA